MAEKYFLGGAPAVAQVSTGTVAVAVIGTTFDIKISNVTIVSVAGVTDIPTTVAALVTAWNLSTHPWAAGITATDSNPAITLTADVPGVPFVVTVSATGGTGTFVLATPTINQGPHVLSQKENWDSTLLPVAGDNLHFDKDISVLWDIDAFSGIVFNDINFYANASSARFGLNTREFVINSDGTSVHSSGIGEYRQTDLFAVATGTIYIGRGEGLGQTRLVLNSFSTAPLSIEVIKTGASVDRGKPAVRINATNAFTDVNVRSGVVGIGTDLENGAANLRDIKVAGDANTRVTIAEGTTYNSYAQNGGVSVISSAVTLTTVDVNGGTLTTEGDNWTLTNLTVKGAGTTCIVNHDKSAGDSVTAVTVKDGAFLDLTKSTLARTVAAITLETGGSYKKNENVTVTSLTSVSGAQNVA